MNQFQEMSERMGRKYHAAGEIKEDLKEPEYEDGAFYCSLPSFRDNYRLVRRLIERNGQSAFLMVCSLTDGNGHPMENREKLDVMSMELHRAVKKQSAPRRFLFQIQPVSVPDSSGRNQPGKL